MKGIAQYKDVIKDFYRKIDGFIGALIENIDAKTVVINVADKNSHHFKEVKDKIENLIQNICLSDGKRIFEVSGEEPALGKLEKDKYDLAAYIVDTQESASSDFFLKLNERR